MITQPPAKPNFTALPIEVRDYLDSMHVWAEDIYSTFKNYDLGQIKLSSGSAVPTGGDDGDLYIRKAGASTRLYLNINGTFSGYTNP